MESLGLVALSETRRVWLQQHGSDEGVALSVVSMDGASVRMGDARLSRGRVHVSGISLVAAAVLLRRLVARDYGEAVAERAVWFFLIFPTAYFLHIGYTEALFLAFLLASLLSARNDRWLLAGLFGALCWMTRPIGIVLLPTLAIEAAHQFWETKRWRWQWLWIALVPVGFGVYLLLNLKIAGSPFAFLPMRKQLFHLSGAWPWIGMLEAYRNRLQSPSSKRPWSARKNSSLRRSVLFAPR